MPVIPIDEVLAILNENYEAAKRVKENAYSLKEYREKDALNLLLETYEDLISIFNNKRNKYGLNNLVSGDAIKSNKSSLFKGVINIYGEVVDVGTNVHKNK